MPELTKVREYLDVNARRFLDLLKEACAIPSVSTEGQGFDEMTGWLEAQLRDLGASVTRLSVPGSPDALLGEMRGAAGAGGRTLMIYDHYDVQPVDPIDLWESAPFDPSERDGRLFARGAADNKGDLVARICALETYREVLGELPFNIKFFIEGEEESGSFHFEQICHKYAEQLKSDDCVWEGGWFDADGRPTIYYGCKGLLYVELRSKKLSGDQHSSIAVYAPSAAWELLRAIASIKDGNGRIAIEGFFEGIEAPTDEELRLIAQLPFNEEASKERLGIDEFVDGLTGDALKREMLFAPTANIAGFVSGYGAPGQSKTVLPAEALAKIDFRLVPGQLAEDVITKLRRHLDDHGFTDVALTSLGAENPSRSPMTSTIGRASEAAAAAWFDEPAVVYPFMWATGPMYPIAQGLGIPICSPAGVGRPDSNLHAPNENCRIDDFLEVIGYTVAYLDEYERLGSAK